MKPYHLILAIIFAFILVGALQSCDPDFDESGISQLCADGTYPEGFCEYRGN